MRCGTVLERGGRLGPDAALVFSLTGLMLALPAFQLPFVRAGKLGDERTCLLFTGVQSLWEGGFRTLAVLIALCGALLPLVLLVVLAALHTTNRLGWPKTNLGHLVRMARILEHWAIPEVQVLAVLVAISKLGRFVEITLGPGFWCYCAMALALLIAQRHSAADATGAPPAGGGSGAAVPP